MTAPTNSSPNIQFSQEPIEGDSSIMNPISARPQAVHTQTKDKKLNFQRRENAVAVTDQQFSRKNTY